MKAKKINLHDPQTTGKIELRHQTLKNRFLVGNYFLLGNFQNQVEALV